jgi:hypothetical protein
MSKKNKRWDSYSDYLKSPEWKAIKEEFYANFGGYNDECEISSEEFEGYRKCLLHLHHFKYPKDWANDSWGNLILICSEVHQFVHGNNINLPTECDIICRDSYKSYLMREWENKKCKCIICGKDATEPNYNAYTNKIIHISDSLKQLFCSDCIGGD